MFHEFLDDEKPDDVVRETEYSNKLRGKSTRPRDLFTPQRSPRLASDLSCMLKIVRPTMKYDPFR
jgi:hypothetical protein